MAVWRRWCALWLILVCHGVESSSQITSLDDFIKPDAPTISPQDEKNLLHINSSNLDGHLELGSLEVVSLSLPEDSVQDENDSAAATNTRSGIVSDPFVSDSGSDLIEWDSIGASANRSPQSAGPLSHADSSRDGEEAATKGSTDGPGSGDAIKINDPDASGGVAINVEHDVEIAETNSGSSEEHHSVNEGQIDGIKNSWMEMNDLFTGSNDEDNDESLFELNDPTEENIFDVDIEGVSTLSSENQEFASPEEVSEEEISTEKDLNNDDIFKTSPYIEKPLDSDKSVMKIGPELLDTDARVPQVLKISDVAKNENEETTLTPTPDSDKSEDDISKSREQTQFIQYYENGDKEDANYETEDSEKGEFDDSLAKSSDVDDSGNTSEENTEKENDNSSLEDAREGSLEVTTAVKENLSKERYSSSSTNRVAPTEAVAYEVTTVAYVSNDSEDVSGQVGEDVDLQDNNNNTSTEEIKEGNIGDKIAENEKSLDESSYKESVTIIPSDTVTPAELTALKSILFDSDEYLNANSEVSSAVTEENKNLDQSSIEAINKSDTTEEGEITFASSSEEKNRDTKESYENAATINLENDSEDEETEVGMTPREDASTFVESSMNNDNEKTSAFEDEENIYENTSQDVERGQKELLTTTNTNDGSNVLDVRSSEDSNEQLLTALSSVLEQSDKDETDSIADETLEEVHGEENEKIDNEHASGGLIEENDVLTTPNIIDDNFGSLDIQISADSNSEESDESRTASFFEVNMFDSDVYTTEAFFLESEKGTTISTNIKNQDDTSEEFQSEENVPQILPAIVSGEPIAVQFLNQSDVDITSALESSQESSDSLISEETYNKDTAGSLEKQDSLSTTMGEENNSMENYQFGFNVDKAEDDVTEDTDVVTLRFSDEVVSKIYSVVETENDREYFESTTPAETTVAESDKESLESSEFVTEATTTKNYDKVPVSSVELSSEDRLANTYVTESVATGVTESEVKMLENVLSAEDIAAESIESNEFDNPSPTEFSNSETFDNIYITESDKESFESSEFVTEATTTKNYDKVFGSSVELLSEDGLANIYVTENIATGVTESEVEMLENVLSAEDIAAESIESNEYDKVPGSSVELSSEDRLANTYVTENIATGVTESEVEMLENVLSAEDIADESIESNEYDKVFGSSVELLSEDGLANIYVPESVAAGVTESVRNDFEETTSPGIESPSVEWSEMMYSSEGSGSQTSDLFANNEFFTDENTIRYFDDDLIMFPVESVTVGVIENTYTPESVVETTTTDSIENSELVTDTVQYLESEGIVPSGEPSNEGISDEVYSLENNAASGITESVESNKFVTEEVSEDILENVYTTEASITSQVILTENTDEGSSATSIDISSLLTSGSEEITDISEADVVENNSETEVGPSNEDLDSTPKENGSSESQEDITQGHAFTTDNEVVETYVVDERIPDDGSSEENWESDIYETTPASFLTTENTIFVTYELPSSETESTVNYYTTEALSYEEDFVNTQKSSDQDDYDILFSTESNESVNYSLENSNGSGFSTESNTQGLYIDESSTVSTVAIQTTTHGVDFRGDSSSEAEMSSEEIASVEKLPKTNQTQKYFPDVPLDVGSTQNSQIAPDEFPADGNEVYYKLNSGETLADIIDSSESAENWNSVYESGVYKELFEEASSESDDISTSKEDEMSTFASVMKTKHVTDRVPFIHGRVFGHPANFSVKIIEEESTLYIPPTAYLLQDTLKPILNITWESSSNTLNNSLSFSLAQISKYYIINGAQLILVQDDELLVWRKNVVIMPETIDGMGTHSCHIKFEDDVEVFVSNMDFLYIGGEVEDNSIDTKPTESSEMTDKRVYHIEVATGSMALVVVVGITMYIIISKARQRALKSKNKANQHVAV